MTIKILGLVDEPSMSVVILGTNNLNKNVTENSFNFPKMV